MIGGDKSFGAGGYLKTPVEMALPVSTEVPTTLDLPGFALILVIDKSSSMAGSIANKNKLEGAKIAAFSAVEMLNPFDRVGVLAFDSEFHWTVPVTQAKNRRKIARELSTLKESGGTDLYPALEEAFRLLKGYKAAKKHIIVLSDGLTNKADFPSLIRALREAHVTVSTVSVGRDSDIVLMKAIAELGGGRSYFTDDANNIPRIFAGETKIAAKKVIVEKDTTTIIEGAGKTSDIKARIAQIEHEYEKSTSDYDREKLQERKAKLTGGVAKISVGGATETEVKEKKMRYEDALGATRAAVEEGIVVGGGVALIRAASKCDPSSLSEDERGGYNIVIRACRAPLTWIAENAGQDGSLICEKVAEADGNFGFNAATCKYEDLVESGVVDPTKVVRTGIENASSVAILLLTSDALIAEKPKEEKKGHGHGGDYDMY